MRTFSVILIIIIVLGLLVTFEKFYIDEFCSETENAVIDLKKSINNKDNANSIISHIMTEWNKRRKILFAIANHNSFKDIEVGLFNLEYAIKTDNIQSARYFADSIHNSINELKEFARFDLSNIL